MIPAAEALTRKYDLLPPGSRVLAAVSGGADSMSLLHWLWARGTDVSAAHLNHRMRGASGDADEAFVRAWCAERDIPFYAGSADVPALARESGVSVEEAGRAARYAFFERIADEIGATRIATAHHANDNAETLLFQLIRGARSGLGGIAPLRGRYIRPFLCVARAQLEAYAAQQGIAYRADVTNEDDAYTRNFLRHEVMPRLERVNAAAVRHMTETALQLRVEGDYLDELARQALADGGAMYYPERVTVPSKTIAVAPEALRGRMLRLLLNTLPAGRRDFTARHYAAVAELCESEYGAWLDLPHGVYARRAGGVLTLGMRSPANKSGQKGEH